MISELKRKHIKFDESNLVFITRDKTGQIVWLENGNERAGLKHILDGNGQSSGHAEHFMKAFGVIRESIPNYLKDVISNGTIVEDRTVQLNGGALGYSRKYSYEGNYFIVTGIGSNGFIVSAYPVRKR